MAVRLVIIGGVAGGATAAVRARRLDESAEIVIIERGDYVSFANCGLPYYAGNVIRERDDLLVQTAEGLKERYKIDIRLRSVALSIDRAAKSVTVTRLTDGKTYGVGYDYLILSPGAEPVMPPIDGADLPCVHRVRTIPDIDRIKARLDSGAVSRAVIIGGGYIGLEMAENIAGRGIATVIIEEKPQVMPQLDEEMAAILSRRIRKSGVDLRLRERITRIEAAGRESCVVHTSGGRDYPADLLVMCVGVKPEAKLARESGLAMGEHGGIVTDSRMRTSDEAIFAVGDAVETKDPITGLLRPVALAGPAAKQARVAANTIFGIHDEYAGTYGTSIVKVFELTAAVTGASERELRKAAIPYDKVYVIPNDHAAYYPGASLLVIKLLFRPKDGRLLGAQVVGRAGADKRIDVLATALAHSLTVEDIAKLELAYAPPYGAAKDPVNVAGLAALNGLQGIVNITHWDRLSGGEFLLDVRTPGEVARGTVQGSAAIPLDELRDRLSEIPSDRRIAVYCAQGYRSYIACRILTQNGFTASNISGGYRMYRNFREAGLLSPTVSDGGTKA